MHENLLLEVTGLACSVRVDADRHQKPVFTDISFSVGSGEIVGIVGPTGAGKTSLFNCLVGLAQPAAGLITYAGTVLPASPKPGPRLRRHLGLVFQDDHLFFDRTVFDNIALPLLLLKKSSPEIRRRTTAVATRIGLSAVLLSRCGSLSAGERRLVALARAVVHEPPLVLADEPLGPISPPAGEVLGLFRELGDKGTGFLLFSSVVDLIEPYCTRLHVLKEGSLVPVAAATPPESPRPISIPLEPSSPAVSA